ncbi:MAG: tripartite tricarboxylate transporter permease [Deltaproteobacteria bacterium]
MDWMGQALANVFSAMDLLVMAAGVAGGILVGALPGLTGTMAIALLVPFTYGLAPDAALVMLGGVYVGAMYGGSIAAILINTPGAPAAIATTFDGYPMAQKGKAEEALASSATGSAIGGLLGTIVLLLFSPMLAAISLKFGPPEYFWLGILGLTIIASLSANSLAKGLLGGLFGVLISTIGLSPSTGVARLTFNISDLLGGVEIIIALIGLFCIPQVIAMAEKTDAGPGLAVFKSEPGRSVKAMLAVLKRWGNLLRSTVIGVIVGIIPGAGGNVAGLLSYQEAMRAAKDKSQFGRGAVDGVIASETANNAEVEGSLIPLLTLGIPGAPQAAVLFGALLLQGLKPGPELFRGDGAVICYTFILSLFLANIVMFLLGFFGSRFYARALNLPTFLLMPVVLALSVVGSFAGRNSSFDVMIMFCLGLLAYGGTKVGMAPAPIALGVILGPIIERGLIESMMLSHATGSLTALFFTQPISIILILLTVFSVGWPLYQSHRHRRKAAQSGESPMADTQQPKRPTRKRLGTLSHAASNLWIAAVGLVVAVLSWCGLIGIELQSSILPWVASSLIALICLGLIVKAWQLKRSGTGRPAGQPLPRGRVAKAVGLAALYVGLNPLIGFFTATFVMVCSMAWLLAPSLEGRNQTVRTLATAAGICLAFYLVFAWVFHVPFPEGVLI